MMHSCPKCNFAQPKDRYCANCGLDIENYKPAPDTLLKKFSKNTGLQIATVIAIVVILSGFIYFSQEKVLETHLKQTPQSAASFNQASSDQTDLMPPEPNEFTGDNSDPAPETTETTSAEATSADADSVAGKAVKVLPTRLNPMLTITFAEASKSLLQALANEGQILNETAQTRSFISTGLIDIQALKARDTEFKLLPGAKTQAFRVGVTIPVDFSHISRTDNEDVGLNLEINPVQILEATAEFNLLGMLNLRSETNQVIAHQDFNANFVFSPQNTLVMVGFLPRQKTKAEEAAPFSNTPLAILESAQFLSGITDFVIFIQIK
jgi:hypothetical protein